MASSSAADYNNTKQEDDVEAAAAAVAAGAPVEVQARFFMTHPEKELFQLMENAQNWIEKEQATNKHNERPTGRDLHRVVLQPARESGGSLEIANSMLEGLAKAHRRLSLPPHDTTPSEGGVINRRLGLEDVATKILNHLWSTRSAHPDARTYAAYLGCLEGQDRLSVANRAKEILDAMTEGKAVDVAGEKPMPKPTIEVVNAVIQLVAQVGGESGRGLVNLGSITATANRDTFLSLLSSMSYPPSVEGETGGFDPIFAEFCIDGMKEAGYVIDAGAYNAGLRWSGGMQSTLSRPYTRPIPWDNHADMFSTGFQELNEENPVVQEAYRMHAWLEDMASEGGAVKPNIETCEAVIQAYIRTGSMEGIQQAEMLLQSLLDAPSSYAMPTPRLQTFHPIIAAWTHSGHEESPQKVNKWIGQLHTLSKGKQESTNIETHLVEAPLLANAKLVLKKLHSQEEITSTEMSDLESTALGCSIHLKDICSRLGSNKGGESPIVGSHVFVAAIQVWGNLGLRYLQSGQLEESSKAFDKMNEIVEEYESLISSLYNTGRQSQIHNLTSKSHRVYSMIFWFLEIAAAASKTATDSVWELDEHIGTIGKSVNRIQEFTDLQLNARNPSKDSIYGDMYSYTNGSETPEGCADSQAEFFMQILRLLRNNVQEPTASPRRGDMVRLCFHIMEMLPSLREQSAPAPVDGKRPFSLVSAHTEVIKTISHLSTAGSEEEEALFGRVLSQADFLLGKGICSASDHDLIVKEVRKQSPSTQARRPRRSRMIRRPPVRNHHPMSHHHNLHTDSSFHNNNNGADDDDHGDSDDEKSILQKQ